MLMKGRSCLSNAGRARKAARRFGASASLSANALVQDRNRGSDKEKARCREEVAAGSISNETREEVRPIQRRHHIWEE